MMIRLLTKWNLVRYFQLPKKIQKKRKIKFEHCLFYKRIGSVFVLAHILVRTVEEFQGMEIEKVVSLIEGDPYISKVPVASRLTNKDRNVEGKRIVGLNTEAGEKNEGLVRFDIIFYV